MKMEIFPIYNSIKYKNNIALLTIFHDKIINFWDDYFYSLKQQAYKNFDTYILMDNNNDYELKFEIKDNLFIGKCKFSVAKIREYAIKYLKKLNYRYLIFLDGDDCIPDNRIQKVIHFLEKFNIIVNDLNLFGDLEISGYISSRIDNRSFININELKEKNILGLSNTAINLNIIDDDFSLPDDIYAVDWYIFTLLLKKGYSAVFTSETHTKYRIWGENLFSKFDEKHFEKIIKIKYLHYKYLVERENFVEYDYLYHYFCKLKELFNKNNENTLKFDVYNYFKNKYEKIQNPFWLEEVTYDEYIKNKIDR